jgi:hypothetical protein
MTEDDSLECLFDLCTIDLASKTNSDALVEAAGALVSVGRVLEVQILDWRQREAGARIRTSASGLGLLFGLCEARSLCKRLNGVGLNDVL